MAVLIAVLAPSLLSYTERSRAQKDVSSMDEVVNAVQLAMANSDCYDEAIKYSCSNNFITYTDSSGKYGQQINDGEYWAPDGSGKATTITFNPEKGSFGQTIYKLENGIVNDMTYGNGSVAQDRIMEGAQIENNQCYLKNMTYLYNLVRQSIGNDVITASATYKNSSFTIFIKFSQKDSVKVADVSGAFNGTNLTKDSQASKGSGTLTYDPNTGNAIQTEQNPGKTEAVFDSSALLGTGTFYPNYKEMAPYDHDAPELHPDDGTKPKVGDTYFYGDYKYTYYALGVNPSGLYYGWNVKLNLDVTDKNQKSYGIILESIHGAPITSITSLFQGCKLMEKSPEIPRNVINVQQAFYDCTALVKAPQLPDTLIYINGVFSGCESLEIAPVFPSSANGFSTVFYGCKSLKTYIGSTDPDGDFSNYFIPTNVTSMYRAFYNCKSIVVPPTIPNKVTNMEDAFVQCNSMIMAPNIPYGVTNLARTFMSCTSLTAPPTIPSSVTTMEQAFWQCTNLTTAPDLSNANKLTNMKYAFYYCHSLKTYVGSKDQDGDFSGYIIPNSVTNMYTTFRKCTSMVTAPTIPSSVTNLYWTFMDCNALTGTITINSNPTEWTGCLYKTKITSVIGDTTMAESIMKTKNSTATNPKA